MHIHILGIGGTFMSGIALLAKEAGFKVTGSDANCYPPISDFLANTGIVWVNDYITSADALKADYIIVGNVMKRGMPILETVMNAGKNYLSGPQWIADNILAKYHVLAVAGTHGKTTTSAMLAYILAAAGLEPGFLIGGISPHFNGNACLGKGKWFIIEADEYDSAFFDKRPKFMHYRPDIAIINNLEFDHADLYPDLAAIEQQFHYYLKTIASKGVVLKPCNDEAINRVCARGNYAIIEDLSINGDSLWQAQPLNDSGSAFVVFYKKQKAAKVNWQLIGEFNIANGLAAIAASTHAGVDIELAAKILNTYTPVKRRLETKYKSYGITVYDDFAHHPTAIAKTIQALHQSKRHKRIFVVLELASYTMRTGIHAKAIVHALDKAAGIYILQPDATAKCIFEGGKKNKFEVLPTIELIIAKLIALVQPQDAVVVMSNRTCGNIHEQLIAQFNLKCHK